MLGFARIAAALWLPAATYLLLAVSVLHGAETASPMTITSIEGIHEYRLSNGLKVLLFPDDSKPTVTVNLTVFVGSRHEGYGEAGMAHLLEHMLFKGTPTHPKIPKELQSRGADYNGTTWVDRTNYYETLPANDANLEFAIKLEADRMVNSYVKGEDLISEMTVVRNEFERGENSPGSVLAQRMMATAFEWHNYGKSTIGNRADIERVPIENLQRFYRKHYQPDNAMLVIAGRFDEQKALGFAEQYFGVIPKPERVLEATYTEEPPQDGERMVTLRRVGDVAVVGAVYHIPSGASPDFAAVDVLESILTQQPSGRLYKALVEQKKAADVSGAAFAWHDPGAMRLMAEVATGNSPEAVLDTMLDTLDLVVDRGVTEEEVDRARQRLLKQRELSAADTAELAVELSEWAAQGDWRLYFLYRDRLEKVTVDDVNRVARAYLQPSNRTVGLYIPTEQPQRTTIPATPELAEMIGDYKGREVAARGEAFDVSPENIDARTERRAIDGIQVAFLPKKTRGESVVCRVTLRYGTGASLTGLTKAAELLPILMTRGTKQLTRQQLQDQLDQNLAVLRSSGGTGEATFVIQTKRDKLSTALSLLQQVLREPTLPKSELEILRRQLRSDLEQGLTDPQSLAVRLVQRTLSPYPSTDVRYIPTVQEELKQVEELDVASIKKLYAEFLGSQAGQVVIVGDFDPEETFKQLEGMLGGWEAKQKYARIPREAHLQVPEQRLVRIETPDKANAFYFGGEVVAMSDQNPDYPALLIGNYIFGAGALSSRLGDRVRQQEGLSYGVGSVFRALSLDERASLSLYAITNPGNIDKVVAAIQEELTRLLKDGVTEAELDAARQGFLQNQAVSRTEDPALARLLEETLYTGRTMKFYAEQEAAIQKLSTADVVESFRKYIIPDRLFIAVAGDFAKAQAEGTTPPAK
ncbi:insulinase family protein [bacterium]|nr:insulinase family protein [bacterium]